MQIHFKIIETYPESRQIVVRFFTDLVTEQHLSVIPNDPLTAPARCRTDVAVELSIPPLVGAELNAFIMRYCNWQFLEQEERKIQAAITVDAELEAAQVSIAALNGTLTTIAHPGTHVETAQELLQKNLQKIDSDVDSIYIKAIGNRATEYAEAEIQAMAYRNAGYIGTVPPYVAIWVSANTKGLTTATQAADDILTQATAWRGAAAAMRTNRLARKRDLQDGVPNAMALWNGFVAYIRAQLFS